MESKKPTRLSSFLRMLGTAAMSAIILMMVFVLSIVIWIYTLNFETQEVKWFQADAMEQSGELHHDVTFRDDTVCVDDAKYVFRIDVTYFSDTGLQARTFRNRALRGNDVLCGSSPTGSIAYSVKIYSAVREDE